MCRCPDTGGGVGSVSNEGQEKLPTGQALLQPYCFLSSYNLGLSLEFQTVGETCPRSASSQGLCLGPDSKNPSAAPHPP